VKHTYLKEYLTKCVARRTNDAYTTTRKERNIRYVAMTTGQTVLFSSIGKDLIILRVIL
jgi:hypothetical protein